MKTLTIFLVAIAFLMGCAGTQKKPEYDYVRLNWQKLKLAAEAVEIIHLAGTRPQLRDSLFARYNSIIDAFTTEELRALNLYPELNEKFVSGKTVVYSYEKDGK